MIFGIRNRCKATEDKKADGMYGRIKRLALWICVLVMTFGVITGCVAEFALDLAPEPMAVESILASEAVVAETSVSAETEPAGDPLSVDEQGIYHTKEEVALYIHTYGDLPDNYITKKEAETLGWDSKQGNLDEAAPGKSIGGSHFGNYEGQLPQKDGRKYFEADINYYGGYRGPERIIYSNDGLIYYTGDHYKTFELLYGGPEDKT